MISRMKYLKEIALFSLMSIPCIASSSELLFAGTNSYTGKARIVTSENVVVEIDKGTNRIYIAQPNGLVSEITIDQAVSHLTSDPQQAIISKTKINRVLSDPRYNHAVRSPRIATDATYWPRHPVSWCGDVICLIEPSSISKNTTTYTHAYSQQSLGGDTCNHYLCPDLPCMNGPCSPFKYNTGYHFYSSMLGGWGKNEGGGTTEQQMTEIARREIHRNNQSQACKDSFKSGALVVTSGIGVVAGCPASATGIGAAACAAGAAGYVISSYDFAEDIATCFSDYTPPRT